MGGEVREYVHGELEDVVMAIGGHYRFTREERFPFRDREVLVLYGYAVYDTTCCGTGGCNYARVVGFIRQWKGRRGEAGLPVTEVEVIGDPEMQREIRRLILAKEAVQQVNFQFSL